MTATRPCCRPAPLTPSGAGVGFGEYAALAQLVEHRIRNAGVAGSNPAGGTISFNGLGNWWAAPIWVGV